MVFRSFLGSTGSLDQLQKGCEKKEKSNGNEGKRRMDNSTKKRSSGVVLKAGIWYTVSNFVFRGMAFITTPVFTRLLTKGEYGDFSNFASWMSILVIITS